MIVCIDTNALMSMLSLSHPNRQILHEWVSGRFNWAVSNEVMTEYEELLLPRIGQTRWQLFMNVLEMISATQRNLIRVEPSFRFNVISSDLDDNKFCDCAIVADADYVITEDKHFQVLAGSGYKPQPLKPDAFLALLQKS
jgi:putative PIN family toxin of toxin-antitoxin system